MTDKRKIFLFTESWPYSSAAEDTFIPPELEVIKQFFDVVAVPLSNQGIHLPSPEGITVEDNFAKNNAQPIQAEEYLSVLLDKSFYVEIFKNPNLLIKRSLLISLLKHLIYSYRLNNWIKSNVKSEKAILYSYWFDVAASAFLTIDKRKYKTITRTHGYDLFFERRPYKYIPMRLACLEKINNVIFASQNSLDYMSSKFPQFNGKYIFSPLGTNNPGFEVTSSCDGVFRIVSCSYCVEVKRINLIIESLKKISTPKIEWYHIGDGQLYEEMRRRARDELPENITPIFLGYKSNKEIFEFYRTNPVDLFITLSASEGGRPVSIQEAISVGIPVLATNVGGIPEIVIHKTNGVLVSANPTTKEVASMLTELINSPEELRSLKANCYQVWQNTANAEVNFEKFAQILMNLGK